MLKISNTNDSKYKTHQFIDKALDKLINEETIGLSVFNFKILKQYLNQFFITTPLDIHIKTEPDEWLNDFYAVKLTPVGIAKTKKLKSIGEKEYLKIVKDERVKRLFEKQIGILKDGNSILLSYIDIDMVNDYAKNNNLNVIICKRNGEIASKRSIKKENYDNLIIKFKKK